MTEDLLERVDVIERKLDALSASVETRFEAVDRRFEVMDRRFEAVDRRFEAVDRRFDEVTQAFVEQREYTELALEKLRREMVGRFDGIEQRLDHVVDVVSRALPPTRRPAGRPRKR